MNFNMCLYVLTGKSEYLPTVNEVKVSPVQNVFPVPSSMSFLRGRVSGGRVRYGGGGRLHYWKAILLECCLVIQCLIAQVFVSPWRILLVLHHRYHRAKVGAIHITD